MRMILRAAAPALVLALAVSAPVRGAETQGYLGASIGNARVEAQIDLDKLDADATGYKIYGGYRVMTHFGLEAAWVDLGQQRDVSTGANLSTEITGWTVEGVGIAPLGKRFELFGKAGLMLADTKIFSDGGMTPRTTDTSTVDLTLGIGAAYAIGHVGFRVELEFFDIESTDSVFLVSAGVEYRF